MLILNLPMPGKCDCAYSTLGKNGKEEYWPCPCYDMERQVCRGVIPNKDLYNPWEGIDLLKGDKRPVWCPLGNIDGVNFFTGKQHGTQY